MSYWGDKQVVVVGGTRGLGFAVTRRLVHAGARVVVVARSEPDLERVCEQLGPATIPACCDVTKQNEVDHLFEDLRLQLPAIDAFFQVAGKSDRRKILETSADDFHRLMELNFYAAVRCAQQASPLLAESSGHLVLIGSLASKAASRYLGAYPATKFALAAYAQQLRLELAETGLHVLHVCPGPIGRSDAGRRYAESTADLPPEANAPGAGVHLDRIDVDWLASRILRGCEKRQAEIVVPGKAKLLFALGQVSPRLGDWILSRKTG